MDAFKIALPNTGRVALIDAADAARVLATGGWSETATGYVRARVHGRGRGRRVLLHHVVMGKPPRGHVVDHINRDKLDNRRSNLRVVLEVANHWNRSAVGRGVSGCRGIVWKKGLKAWQVGFYKGNHFHLLGYHRRLEDAMAVATLGIAILYGRHTGYYDDLVLGRDFDEVCEHAESTFERISEYARRRLLGLKAVVHADTAELFRQLEALGEDPIFTRMMGRR